MGMAWALLFIYLFAPVVLFVCLVSLRSVSIPKGAATAAEGSLWLDAFVLAPVLLALQLNLLLTLWKAEEPYWYWLTLVMAWGAAGMVLGLVHIRKLVEEARCLSDVISPRVLLAICCAFAAILMVGLLLPLQANDPVQYFKLAQLILQRKGMDFYPMTAPVEPSGFVVYMRHPLGYPLLMSWHLLGQGIVSEPAVAKIISVWYWLILCIILIYIGRNRPLHSSIIAVGGFVCTPILCYQMASHGVDPVYLAPLLLLAIRLSEAGAEAVAPFWLLRFGLLGGAALFVHSIGAVSVFLLLVAYLIGARRALLSKRFLVCIVTGLLAMILGGHRYMENILSFHSPVADTAQVWMLPELARGEFIAAKLGLETLWDRFFKGVFMAWSRFYYWPLAWLATLFLPAVLVGRYREKEAVRISGIFVLLYLFLNIILIISGNDISIRGSRYFLPLLPFLSVLVMFGSCTFSSSLSMPMSEKRCVTYGIWRIGVVGLALGTALVGILLMVPAAQELVTGSDRAWFHHRAGQADSVERLVAELEKRAAGDGRVLLDRMDRVARFTDLKYIRTIDSSLVPFYRAGDMGSAYEYLRRLNITHVMVTGPSAALEHSVLASIIGSGEFASLLFRNGAGEIYQLGDFGIPPQTFNSLNWQEEVGELEVGSSRSFHLDVPGQIAFAGGRLCLEFSWQGKGAAILEAIAEDKEKNVTLGQNIVVLTAHGGSFGTQYLLAPGYKRVAIRITAVRNVSAVFSPLSIQWR